MKKSYKLDKAKIDALLKAKGLNATQLADKSGIAKSHLSTYLSASVNISANSANRLAAALGVSVEEITVQDEAVEKASDPVAELEKPTMKDIYIMMSRLQYLGEGALVLSLAQRCEEGKTLEGLRKQYTVMLEAHAAAIEKVRRDMPAGFVPLTPEQEKTFRHHHDFIPYELYLKRKAKGVDELNCCHGGEAQYDDLPLLRDIGDVHKELLEEIDRLKDKEEERQ
jgi:transcriptional regulator with XRE-family HTH domain